MRAHFEPVAEIGGDYYDYLPTGDGRTAVALGDVSGHGLPTGLLVAMAKAGLSTLLEAGHRDAELFGRMNELIHRSTDPRHFMTLVLLSYDRETRRGRLTNAGHLAPYRISGGRVEALSLPGLPLGLFPDRTFPTQEYAFAAGDLVVILTDGFVEAVDDAGRGRSASSASRRSSPATPPRAPRPCATPCSRPSGRTPAAGRPTTTAPCSS